MSEYSDDTRNGRRGGTRRTKGTSRKGNSRSPQAKGRSPPTRKNSIRRKRDREPSYDSEYDSESYASEEEERKNEPSRNMANVTITTKGYRTQLVNTQYVKKSSKYEVQELTKKELMRSTNTQEWTGMRYRIPTELLAAFSVRTGRRSSRRGTGRNGGDLKFDIESFKVNGLESLANPTQSNN
jgi:hypothetical protein